ncbi:MAG: hypothetical protein JWM46_53 [Candidatus Kaiserbacteria bacterium]|nr:hypothetical protein [Candidatus Kaiserbacteria bacterium]
MVIILAGGYWYYSMHKTVASAAPTNSAVATMDMGTYPYECDEHVMMSITPSHDMSTLKISGTDGAAYPPTVTLAKVAATSGVKYQGGEFTFTGKGESVTLTQGDQSLNCSPVANPDAAPFNFGD